MFIQNKYSTWYYNIICAARARPVVQPNEIHHILPKSLGGSNNKTNLVPLSIREHYICHLLLTKFTVNDAKSKMFYALHRITNSSTTKIKSSRIYEYLRINHSSITSARMKLNNPNKHGRKPTIIQSAAIRKSNSDRIWTDESKLKVSKSQKIRKLLRPKSFNKGVPKTSEHRQSLSESKIKKAKNNAITYTWYNKTSLETFIGTAYDLSDKYTYLTTGELKKIPNEKYAGYKSYKDWIII